MENIPDDELISAYLDGELTGKDLARAEQLLASQPDSRQMLEELTALRASLKSLPQQKLGPDFAESILRRAEREMLQPDATGDVGGIGTAAAPAPVDTWKPEVPPILSMSRWTRPLIWSALATAAAVMVMMFSPPDAKQKVAVAPAPQVNARPDLAGQNDVQRFEAQAATAPNNEALNNEAQLTIGAPNIASDRFASDQSTSPPTAGAGAGAMPAIAAPGSGTSGFYAGPSPVGGRGIADQFAVPPAARIAAGADATLLVVRCEVTPEVARSANFRRLLAEHQIPWQEEIGPANLADREFTVRGKEDALESATDESAQAAEKTKDGDRGSRAKQGDVAAAVAKSAPSRNQGATADDAAPPAASNVPLASAALSGTEAVYVIATPAQVDATVEAIADSADYRNVQMKELAGPLPAELFAGIREYSDRKSDKEAAQDSAAPAEFAKDGSPQLQRNRGRSQEGADRREAPSTKSSARMSAPAAVPSAAKAPGSAGGAAPSVAGAANPSSTQSDKTAVGGERKLALPRLPSANALRSNSGDVSPALAQPGIALAAPAALSSETIAQLSRAVGDAVSADVAGASRDQSDEQRADKKLSDKPAGDRKPLSQATTNDPSDGVNAPSRSYRGEKLPATAAPPAPAAPPVPVANPAAAPLADAPLAEGVAPAAKAAADEKRSTGSKPTQPQPRIGKESGREVKGSFARDAKQSAPGDAQDQERESMQKQEKAQSPEGVAPKRAIFLFRIVPAPDAAGER